MRLARLESQRKAGKVGLERADTTQFGGVSTLQARLTWHAPSMASLLHFNRDSDGVLTTLKRDLLS
jgi:hypothetical protein